MTSSASSTSFPSRSDRILLWLLRTSALVVGLIVVLIALFLVRESMPALKQVGFTRFFVDESWYPTVGLFNLTPMITGTLIATILSVLIATPLGILSGVFCHFYAPPKLAAGYRRLIELLAGIPSVVYGFWGLVTLVPLIARLHPPGPSLLAGVVILGMMILPTIALMADASLANVPRAYLAAAAGLGFSRWGTIRRIVLPSAKSGLFTAVILSAGRAIGETMAVLMVCGNVIQTPQSIFDPIRTLTANIALEMAYAMDDHRSALFLSGLVLLALIAALVSMAEWISRKRVYD